MTTLARFAAVVLSILYVIALFMPLGSGDPLAAGLTLVMLTALFMGPALALFWWAKRADQKRQAALIASAVVTKPSDKPSDKPSATTTTTTTTT